MRKINTHTRLTTLIHSFSANKYLTFSLCFLLKLTETELTSVNRLCFFLSFAMPYQPLNQQPSILLNRFSTDSTWWPFVEGKDAKEKTERKKNLFVHIKWFDFLFSYHCEWRRPNNSNNNKNEHENLCESFIVKEEKIAHTHTYTVYTTNIIRFSTTQ